MSTAWLLLRRFSFRHWRLAPVQSLLLLVILSLGVGVFTAIRLANRAAISSFQNFTGTLVGQSDWVVEPPIGSLKESVLPELRSALGSRPIQIIPIVETSASIPVPDGSASALDGNTVTLLGLDLVGISNLAAARGFTGGFFGKGEDLWTELRGGARAWVSPSLAGSGKLQLVIGDRPAEIRVAGVIPSAPGAPPPADNLVIMDLPALQKLCGMQGRLDRVEFVCAQGPDLDQRRRELGQILERLGQAPQWVIRTPGMRRDMAEQMTQAFRLNLSILSLMALLVGLYLIFQALDGAVVRRRMEIAVLRSLGFNENAVRAAWLIEAAALGCAGGAVGLAVGWLGAQGAVRLVGRTVNTLYFATTVKSAAFEPGEAWIGLAIGVGASIAAGWWPAKEAAQVPPAQVLVRSGAPAIGAKLWRSPIMATGIIAAGLLLARLPAYPLPGGGRFPVAGYAASLAWIIGGGMLCAATLEYAARIFRGLGSRAAPLRVAAGHLLRPSGRHRLAAAAVVCAIGMSAGMAILVASFERTVRTWVFQALQADVYLSSSGSRGASVSGRIAPETWRALASHQGVRQAWILSAYPLQLGAGPPTMLTGTDLALVQALGSLPWVEAPRDDAVFDPLRSDRLALVSESFSERFGRHRGDALEVPTAAGTQQLLIAGVFSDYGNERGSIVVDRARLARWMGDDSATHVSLFVKPGVNPDAMRTLLRREFPGLQAFTNANLREEILRVFRQTFAITYALELIGIVVAIIGIALTMTSILLDRRDELKTLRVLGFTPAEVAVSASFEGVAVALWSVVWGLALSAALGWLLVTVINKQSFGWTLTFAWPWGQLGLLSALVAGAAWAASFAAGIWCTRLAADQEP